MPETFQSSLRPERTAGSILAESWIPQVERRMDQLLAYGPNWDGRGAPRIRFEGESLEMTKRLLWLIAAAGLPQPNVVPTVDGAIGFEWHAGDTSLEITPEATGRFSVFFCEPQETVEPDDQLQLLSIEMMNLIDRMNQAISHARTAQAPAGQ